MTNQMDWLLLRGTAQHIGEEFLAPFDERVGAINRIMPMMARSQDRRRCAQYFVRCLLPFRRIVRLLGAP